MLELNNFREMRKAKAGFLEAKRGLVHEEANRANAEKNRIEAERGLLKDHKDLNEAIMARKQPDPPMEYK